MKPWLTLVLLFSSALAFGRTYSTNFPAQENPLSQSGNWQVPGSLANQWGNVQTLKSGTVTYASGVSLPTQFGDPTAILTGTWGPNQTVQETIKTGLSATAAGVAEVEIRLRMTITSNNISGYEILCPTQTNPGYGVQVVRWNGANGSFANLPQTGNTAAHQCVNNDVIMATITGTTTVTINVYLNGVLFTTGTDDGTHGGAAFQSGNPGLGFYDNQDNNWAYFGATNFTATDGQSLAPGVIANSRAIDWSGAGLPPFYADGETTPNPWTPPTRTQCGATLQPLGGGQDDEPQIKAALRACTPGHFVLLGGDSTHPFTIATEIRMNQNASDLNGVNYVTLRGSGPMVTQLNITAGNGISLGSSSNVNPVTLASSPAQGAMSVTLSSGASVPVVGQVAWIEQANTTTDTGGLFFCSQSLTCAIQNGGGQLETQAVLVTSVSGATIGISPGLYAPNWTTAQGVSLHWNSNSFFAYGVGLEDLTVFTNTTGITIDSSYGSWVKGVRILGNPPTTSLGLGLGAKNSLLANNYISRLSTSAAFEMFVYAGDSDELIVNNIWDFGLLEGGGNSSGEVLAYNYVRDNNVGGNPYGEISHQAGTSFNLMEGNQMPTARDDDTWGTHNLNSFFRNYFSCWDVPYAGNSYEALLIGSFARFENAVGNALGSLNALGTAPQCPTYSSSSATSDVFTLNAGPGDSLTIPSLLRWGNYAVCTGTNCNAVNFLSGENPTTLTGNAAPFNNLSSPSQTLPSSLFMPGSVAPSWWSVCKIWSTFPSSCNATQVQPYPAIGPEITTGTENPHAKDIPAAVAWKNLPIDPTYQSSATIGSSSWSAGIETLSGLSPAFSSIPMGGFQLGGAATACNPSSGELILTTATTTSVSYVLASNPGTCSGTVKWPDIRQFDERVFGASAIPQVATPSISPNGGNFSSPTSVTLTDATTGAAICYTKDGTTPTTNGAGTCTGSSFTYTGAFTVSVTSTVNAVGTLSGDTDSGVASATFTIGPQLPYAPAPMFALK